MSQREKRRMMKKVTSVILSAAMVCTMIPEYTTNVVAADNTPYVISAGRAAYSSSDNGDSTADKAVDGDTTTRWESEHGVDPQWYYVDLGKVADITKIDIHWEGAYATEYKIQLSNDEESWRDIYSTSNCKGGNETLSLTGSARYVRIYMTKRALNYGYSFYEFQVTGLNGAAPRPEQYGENLARNKSVTSSGYRKVWWMYDDAGNLKPESVAAVQESNAVDGDENTSFTSLEEDNQWIYVDLGRNYEIGRIIVKWAESGGKIYDIDVSNDANNWRTVYRQLSGYADMEENLPIYVQSARYVRIYGYSRVNKNGDGFKINEIEVYKYITGEEKKTYTLSELPKTQIVSASKGSYVRNDMYLDATKNPAYIDKDNISVPIESTDWWQSAMIKKFGNIMSTLPFKTGYSKRGLSILTTTEGWLPTPGATDVNLRIATEETPDMYILPENFEASTAYDRVHDYSDYTASLQLCDTNGVAMTSTHVKGSPYMYLEFGDRQAFYLSVPNLTTFYNDAGNEILTKGTSLTTDHIGVHVTDMDNKAKTKTSNSYYCITLPQGTVIKNNGGKLKITFPGNQRYASVATMQNKGDLNTYYQHGYAFVTDSNVTYTYDDHMAKVTSNYDVTTELKRAGFSNQTMQLMLPHQWKNSPQESNKVCTFTSVRGDLHGIWANHFETVDTFDGLLPTFAMPTSNDFDQAKVLEYLYTLENATNNLNPASDAYWEGKNLHPLGMGVLMADQLGETELRDVFLSRLKKILVNWFTYDGPEDPSFFIYDKSWGTLYYKQSEFGANWGICDHHFTYGYFMFGITVLATYDKEFYNNYKDMIEMLMRDYGNPSGNDSEYCRFRSYDLYEGHSWAGGYADNDSGNNQESASESLFSWVSMYLWGVLTEDDTYRDAGIFGFTNEMEAIKQYWFDYDKDNWLSDWPYEVVAQVYGSTNFYGTFFGGQPLYCYGIQWLPVSEYLTYYGMNQKRATEIYQGLLNDTEDAMNKAVVAARNEGQSQEAIDKMLKDYPQADTGWQHITWAFLSQTNPTLALQKFNDNVDKVQRTDTANTYWFLQAMKELGVRTENIIATGDLSASVYYNQATNKYTANVWNPCDTAKVVTFKNATGTTLGTAKIGAKSLVSFEVNTRGGFAYTQVATPTFNTTSLSDGKTTTNVSGNVTYDDTQLVEIACAEAGATIYYTTDGSIPTTSSKVYAGKILISSSSTLKAIAVKNGYIDSTFASLSFTINGDSVQGKDNLALGKHVEVSSVQAADAGYAASNLTDGNPGTRWASLGGDDNQWCYVDLGQNYAVNTVALNWEAAYAKEYEIQVSTNGNNWTTVATVSNGAQGERSISFEAVNARYVKVQGITRVNEGYGYSLYEMEVYGAVKAATPTITPISGTYNGAKQVTISTTVKGAEIKYTLDGSVPTEDSPSYIAPFTIDRSTVVKAVTYRKGMTLSDVKTSTIIIRGTVGISASEMVVAVGNTKQLSALTEGTVTWSSSNNNIARVDANGKVTGVNLGTATITATVGNNTATCVVTVTQAVKMQSLTLSSTALTMKVKTSDALVATIAPANTTDDTTLTWSSSDSSVVSVNNGAITAKKVGTATITVTCGNFRATCTVTVEPKYTTEEKLLNPEYNVLLNGTKLHESGRFEGELNALIDKRGFGADIGINWASQTVNSGAKDAFIIMDLDKGYTIKQIEAMYILWKNNNQTLPTDGFKIMVANDANYNVSFGTGTVAAGGAAIEIVTADRSNWTTVFDSAYNQATNASGGYDWAATNTGCLSILPFSNNSYAGTFNHIKIAFNNYGSEKPWGIQAYEIALLINDEDSEEEQPTVEVPTKEEETFIEPETKEPEPTTPEPITKPEPTTVDPGVEQPVVPFGVDCKAGKEDGTFTIVMGNLGNGQTYNIYVDGKLIRNVALGEHTFTDVLPGEHTVTITGVLNGLESAGVDTVITVTGTAQEPTTVESGKVVIDGFQISTTVGGNRTLYTVDNTINGKKVTEAGLVYGLAAYATKEQMDLDTNSAYVKAFAATGAGILKTTDHSKTYVMTMVQNIGKISAAGLSAKYYVRAYAKLSNGTYVYSDVAEYSVYSIADTLYRRNEMTSPEAHNYLYDNILKVVNSAYPKKEYDWKSAIIMMSDVK